MHPCPVAATLHNATQVGPKSRPRAALTVCHALAAHNPSGQPNPRKIAFPYGSPKADQPWENESPTHECCDPVRTMHKTFVKDCTILRQNHDCAL